MSWLEGLWNWIRHVFSPSPPALTVQPCQNALNAAAAQALFNRLQAHTEIPFDYPPDCCYARASAMADLMAAEGVSSRKVWTYGTLAPTRPDGSAVRFPPRPGGRQVTWVYHVAPTVNVRGDDGVCREMVMDPSLSNRPVTVAEWNRIMSGPGASISQTSSTDSGVYYREPSGTNHYETAVDNRRTAFADHIATRDASLAP